MIRHMLKATAVLGATLLLCMGVGIAWANQPSPSTDRAHGSAAAFTAPATRDASAMVRRVTTPSRMLGVKARSGLPRLLTVDFSRAFAVRPATITPTGDGSAFISGLKGKRSPIHWRTWTASQADAVATIWIDNGIPNNAQGTFFAHRATVQAYRVRKGRFTRLTIRFRQQGSKQTWALSLARSGPGYVWN